MALSGTFRLALQIYDDGDQRDLFAATPARHLIQTYMEFVDGSTDGTINVCYSDTGTVLAGETNGMTLVDNLDPWGRSNVFTAVKLIVLRNNSTTADDTIFVGPDNWLGPWNALTDRNRCDPGIVTPIQPGLVILYNPRGWGDIESGVTDTFSIENEDGDNDVSYSILIAGEGLAT